MKGAGGMKKIAPYWVVAGLLAVFLIVNMVVTNRPLSGYKMLQIEEIATLPDTPELADVRRSNHFPIAPAPLPRPQE